jgi:hypothetical protein
MAKKKQKPRDFNEPWITTRSKRWEAGFALGPPTTAATPEELRERIFNWNADRERFEKNADWIIWGSRLSEPTVCFTTAGEPVYTDDKRILAVSRMLGTPDGTPDQEEYAKRITACVNALVGIADPEAFVTELKEFLLDMAKDPIDEFFEGRAIRLLSKCTLQEDLIKNGFDVQDGDYRCP